MQTTPKARPGNLKTPQKKSPAATPRTARRFKTETRTVSSPNLQSKTPKSHGSKTQKKRVGEIPELESRKSRLQEELKKAKEELNASEASKRRARVEAEEIKQQLLEISVSEDSRIDELRKLSQEQDKAWLSELEAMRRQHMTGSAALGSAMNEVQELKARLSESESAPQALVENLRIELGETLSLVEKLKGELFDAEEAEAEAREFVSANERRLEMANSTAEMLRSDTAKMSEACNDMETELERSKSEVRSLEELVEQLEEEREARETSKDSSEEIPIRDEEADKLREELNLARRETNQLKSELEEAETRYHAEYIQSKLQIRSAYEQVEVVKSEYSQRAAKLEEELKNSKDEAEALRERLTDKEDKMRIAAEENETMNARIKENKELISRSHENQTGPEFHDELKKLEADVSELKANLMDKEMELQIIMSQNDTLRSEIEKIDSDKNKVTDEALEKLGNATEETNKCSKRTEHEAEQLGAAQATNTELEAELRRVKVQCHQWRKAAEAAASMLSGGDSNNDEKSEERMGSMESTVTRNVDIPPYLDDSDDELSPKKKNRNMLRKIGVLLKKGQK